MMTKCCSQCRFFTLFELYYFLCKESVLPLLSMQEMFQTRDLILRPWLLLFLFRHEKIKTSKGFLFFRVSTPSSFSEHIISNSRFVVVKPSAVQSIPWLRCISSSFWKKEPLLFWRMFTLRDWWSRIWDSEDDDSAHAVSVQNLSMTWANQEAEAPSK